jgi:hypothetical protein
MRLKRYNEFNKLNEEVPINMDFYQKQDVPFFNDDQKSSLEEMGFEKVESNYAVMTEGDYIIRAIPIMNTSGGGRFKWLSDIRIQIFSVDKNGKAESVDSKSFKIGCPNPNDWTTGTFINFSGKENGNPGVICDDDKKQMIRFMIENIPTLGLHDTELDL